MKFYFTGIMFLLGSSADSQMIVAGGGSSLAAPALREICGQMTAGHLEDIEKLNALYRELKLLTEQTDFTAHAEELHALVRQIKAYSARIRFMAKPEWNSENIPVQLRWMVPHSIFFDNTDFLKLKQKIRDAPVGRSVHIGQFLMFRQNLITGKSIVRAEFLNSENADIRQFLSLKTMDGRRTEYDNDRNFVISYTKNVTALEACQFLQTLVFEVQISYVEHLLGIEFNSTKNIYLIYRNGETDEN